MAVGLEASVMAMSRAPMVLVVLVVLVVGNAVGSGLKVMVVEEQLTEFVNGWRFRQVQVVPGGAVRKNTDLLV
jgi:hypothetical protein